MNEFEGLERASEIADARLGVAENFALPVATLLACVVYLTWHSWIFAVGAWALGFFLSTYQLRKASNAAEDAHMKATKTGRYYEGPSRKTDAQS